MGNVDDFMERVNRLHSEGAPFHEAIAVVRLEQRLAAWPEDWGDSLELLVYGELQIPEDIDLPELGIHVAAEPYTEPWIGKAPFTYQARVSVPSRDLAGALSGIHRLETLLSLINIGEWGRAIRYYCRLVAPTPAAGGGPVDFDKLRRALCGLHEYSQRQQTLILRAGWWFRSQQQSFLTGQPSPSAFAEFTGQWQALECLAEAICDRWPPPKLTTREKNQLVAQHFGALGRTPTAADVASCYRKIVDPGAKKRIEHALGFCFQETASEYVAECFTRQPRERQLYAIRNDIHHGNIVEYDLDQGLRVQRGLHRLHMIVLNIFHFLLGIGILLDNEIRSCYTCQYGGDAKDCSLGLLPSDKAYWRYVCDGFEPRENYRPADAPLKP